MYFQDMNSSDLRFHTRHGVNCVVVNEGRSAARPRPREEFNDAIVMSNRPLRCNEMFEVVIDKMVDRWSGSLDCGTCRVNKLLEVITSQQSIVNAINVL